MKLRDALRLYRPARISGKDDGDGYTFAVSCPHCGGELSLLLDLGLVLEEPPDHEQLPLDAP